MALGSTQPLVKMSTRNIPGGKGGRCVRLTTYHHTVKSRSFNFLDPCGPARPVTGVLCYTSWNPLGRTGPVMGLLYFYLYCFQRLLLLCGSSCDKYMQTTVSISGQNWSRIAVPSLYIKTNFIAAVDSMFCGKIM